MSQRKVKRGGERENDGGGVLGCHVRWNGQAKAPLRGD